MIIAFCIPGRQQSMEWTQSWDKMKNYMFRHDIDHYLYQKYSADIYEVRNTLVSRELQVPWEMMPCFGGVPYDYMMWIDGDIGFKPEDVMKLVNSGKDIISGVCPMGPTNRCPVGEYGFNENGQATYRFINIPSLDELDQSEPIQNGIQYAGFGFIAIRKGVFEAMEYPWFRTTLRKHGGRDSNPSEDIGFCLRAGDRGFKVWLHPGMRLTHNKELCLKA